MIVGFLTLRFDPKHVGIICISLIIICFLMFGKGNLVEGVFEYGKDLKEEPLKHLLAVMLG